MKTASKISVAGLGKLGACLAACLAYKGFLVLGFDVDRKTVALINHGRAPVTEPRLGELIAQAKINLAATTNPREIMNNSDITFVIVPTPSTKTGDFSTFYLKQFFKTIAPFLSQKKDYHLFVIVSTVLPGTVNQTLIPYLERYSNKKVNQDFGVCYGPEFIALGSVIRDTLNPDLVLIGESHRQAGDVLEKIYRQLCENSPPLFRMSITSAEIAKLALNSYVTMKISFANTLGEISEHLPEVDVDAITAALGADKRISPRYLKAGPAFGGPCFPRDNTALRVFARRLGITVPLAAATDSVNSRQAENLLQKTVRAIDQHHYRSIAVLGLSYKNNTPVIEEAPALHLIRSLLKRRPRLVINVYDPLSEARENARRLFKNRLRYWPSLGACLARAPLWLLLTPQPEFANISRRDIRHNPTTVIDAWRLLDPANLGPKVKYVAFGKFSHDFRS